MYDTWRTLGLNFSRHVFVKTATTQRSMLLQCLTSCRQIWQVHKIIAEDVNRPGEIRNSAPNIFYDSISAVLYAANRDFSSNACRKLMTRTIENRQDGIRVKIVLNLINNLKMVETEFDSRIDG